MAVNSLCLLLLASFLSASLAIPRSEFYSFGSEAGDNALSPNDDGSSGQITLLNGAFPYFDDTHTTLYVNNNGDISFDGPLSTFTPNSFPLTTGLSLIAPYWADVDTRGTGTVYYRETRDLNLLRRARDDVMAAFSIRFQPIFLFVATWDRVGHFNRNTQNTVTFQCVLMTDGVLSFVKFLYADGEIEWTTGDASGGSNGLGGTPAQVGFDAGDGQRFFSVPGSQTNEIINIASTSNIGVPGVWTFQVNGNVSQCDSESDISQAPLVITPRAGNMLGGTAVSISGPCLVTTDTVMCQFEGLEPVDAYVDQLETDEVLPLMAVCVSPGFNEPGSKNLHITVTDQNGAVKYSTIIRFYAVYFDDSIEVQHAQEELLVHPDTILTVSWNPSSVVPMHVENPDQYTVDIYLVQFDRENQWESLERLVRGHENTGQAEVSVPILVLEGQVLVEDVRAVAVQVRVSSTAIDGGRRKRQISSLIQQLEGSVMQWTSSLYYSLGNTFRMKCAEWCEEEPDNIGETIVNELTPCPPQLRQARSPNSGLIEDSGLSRVLSNTFFHRGTETCFRSRQASRSGYGQQCCYDNNDALVAGAPGGGTVDKVAPIGFLNTLRHFEQDVIPSLWCCFGDQSSCQLYYSKRPSDNGTRYNPPNPACVYGDPHIVTLDGLKYTFNGLGEYLLAEVGDGTFTFQGRMIQAIDPQGDPVNATVFSAIAMREGESDVVQFQTGVFPDDPEALVNGEFVDFIGLPAQELNGVAITKDGNTLTARFDSGAYVEVREANGFLATLLVSLPTAWQGQTSGLMGNYNNNTSDDLTPRAGNPLPLNAGLRDIHEMFGVTWIISDAEDSIFTYPEGQNWTTYYFPDFEPAYEITFSDPALEQAADEMCGDDLFCRFDIATTSNTMIGLSTLSGNQEFEEIVNNSRPIVCDPPCANGVCVQTDFCSCSAGYSGDTCETVEVTECDSSPCENGASCEIRAGSYICTCRFGFTGTNCQTQVVIPPPSVQVVDSDTLLVEGPILPDLILNEVQEILVYANGRVQGLLGPFSQDQLVVDELFPMTTYVVYLEVCSEEDCILSRSVNVTTPDGPTEPPFSGSGVTPPADCQCERSVECSIEGELLNRPGQAAVSGGDLELKCTISFADEMIDTGSGGNFAIDGSFSSEFLSAGSLAFLINLGVLTREEGFTDCSVPNGLPVNNVQRLALTYIRDDGSFGSARLSMEDILLSIETMDFSLNGQLDEINECSFLTLARWLSTQPSPLASAECRDNGSGQRTDIFFQPVDCSNSFGF